MGWEGGVVSVAKGGRGRWQPAGGGGSGGGRSGGAKPFGAEAGAAAAAGAQQMES